MFFLRDKDDHPRVQIRMDITKEIIGRYTPHCHGSLERRNDPAGADVLAVYLGDWVSYYLAILHRRIRRRWRSSIISKPSWGRYEAATVDRLVVAILTLALILVVTVFQERDVLVGTVDRSNGRRSADESGDSCSSAVCFKTVI